MKREDMKVGQQVAISVEVELYPIGIFEHGLLGTVEEICEPNPDVVAIVRLHQHFDELNEWDNCLQVCVDDTFPCSPENFEPIPCQHRDDGRGCCIDCGAFL
jgi:hypothetical protein